MSTIHGLEDTRIAKDGDRWISRPEPDLGALRALDDHDVRRASASAELRRWVKAVFVAFAAIGMTVVLNPLLKTSSEDVAAMAVALAIGVRVLVWSRLLEEER